ncbi:MAG: MBL fold metallo-hydrolase [Oscillospiraceae bacterium]|nr:MBL fold metallo-hydrolase [Oscillospiraceae bacterium]
MIVKRLQVGPIQTNCYLIGDEKTKLGAIIDPGDESRRIWKEVQSLGLDIQFIMLTHGHYDHTTGVDGILQKCKVPVYIHSDEVAMSGSRGNGLQFESTPQMKMYGEGDRFALGDLTIEVMHTPGHSKGSVTLKVGDALFTGDTLFRDSCGRTDFYGGSYSKMMQSLKRLHDLEGDYQVYPGHEAPTTLSRERMRNLYMREAVK